MTTAPNTPNNNPFPLPVKHAPGPRQGEWTYNDYAKLANNNQRYEIMNGVLIRKTDHSILCHSRRSNNSSRVILSLTHNKIAL
jgi:hypothetical protein